MSLLRLMLHALAHALLLNRERPVLRRDAAGRQRCYYRCAGCGKVRDLDDDTYRDPEPGGEYEERT